MRRFHSAIALICLLCAIGWAMPLPQHRSTSKQFSKKKKTPNQLRSDLASLRRRKAQLKHELAIARKATKQVQYDIKSLDANLERLEDQLHETQSALTDSVREQRDLGSQLVEATDRVAVVREQVKKRLKYMYMHRGETVLSAFMGAKSVGEIASRKLVLTAIAHKDRSLFDEFRDLQARIKDRKHRQDQVVHRIASLKDRQLNQQASLEVTKDEKQDALHSLKQRQNDIKALLAQLESDEASVYSQIRAYEAAKRRRPKRAGQPEPPVFVGRFLKPAGGPITSSFGMRMHPILHYRRLHAGVDIGAGYGSPIKAAGDGVVIAAQYSRSYGNMVVIDHGNGLSTLYAHGSRLYCHAGQTVKRGQVIAAVGATGLAQGPHLHWEVRVNGRPVNPMGRF